MKHINRDYVSKAWVYPPVDLGDGAEAKIQLFQNIGVGSKCQNSTFSEHGHVAYQIKGNVSCSNMVANSLPV